MNLESSLKWLLGFFVLMLASMLMLTPQVQAQTKVTPTFFGIGFGGGGTRLNLLSSF